MQLTSAHHNWKKFALLTILIVALTLLYIFSRDKKDHANASLQITAATASFVAQNNLNKTLAELQKTFEKISQEVKIKTAINDADGLALDHDLEEETRLIHEFIASSAYIFTALKYSSDAEDLVRATTPSSEIISKLIDADKKIVSALGDASRTTQEEQQIRTALTSERQILLKTQKMMADFLTAKPTPVDSKNFQTKLQSLRQAFHEQQRFIIEAAAVEQSNALDEIEAAQSAMQDAELSGRYTLR